MKTNRWLYQHNTCAHEHTHTQTNILYTQGKTGIWIDGRKERKEGRKRGREEGRNVGKRKESQAI